MTTRTAGSPFGQVHRTNVTGFCFSRYLFLFYFFEKFPNFCGQICGLGSISVRFRFTKFLPSVVQPTAHLSWISVMIQVMDE